MVQIIHKKKKKKIRKKPKTIVILKIVIQSFAIASMVMCMFFVKLKKKNSLSYVMYCNVILYFTALY